MYPLLRIVIKKTRGINMNQSPKVRPKYLTYLFDMQSKEQLYKVMPWLKGIQKDVKLSKVENK